MQRNLIIDETSDTKDETNHNNLKKNVRLPGFEPGTPAWKAGMITTTLQARVLNSCFFDTNYNSNRNEIKIKLK